MLISRIVLVAGLVLVGAAQADAQTVRVKEETPGLLQAAKVSPADAQKAALAKVPGGTVMSAEIERDDGKLLYEYDIKVSGETGFHEVDVDAMTGAVVSHNRKSRPEKPDSGNDGRAYRKSP